MRSIPRLQQAMGCGGVFHMVHAPKVPLRGTACTVVDVAANRPSARRNSASVR